MDGLDGLAGVRTPAVGEGDITNYKDFTLMFDETFGLDRDSVAHALRADGIETRRYFWPAVHRQRAYAHLPKSDLPVTDAVARSVLSLPMFGDLRTDEVDRVVDVLRAIHDNAGAVVDHLRAEPPADRAFAKRAP
jgi:dTDP-4-amino-4,6-dideoxygalactose transaminase